MKVQRLIEKYKKLEGVWDAEGAELARQIFLQDLEQLDEPEKVVVPQFVADWIESSKQEKRNLRNALNNGSEKMRLWLLDQENYDLFARAWLTDYEAEKEPKYKVKLKNTDDYLNQTETGFHFFNNWKNNEKFTRKELEYSGFGEVFNSPLFEVEEVE